MHKRFSPRRQLDDKEIEQIVIWLLIQRNAIGDSELLTLPCQDRFRRLIPAIVARTEFATVKIVVRTMQGELKQDAAEVLAHVMQMQRQRVNLKRRRAAFLARFRVEMQAGFHQKGGRPLK